MHRFVVPLLALTLSACSDPAADPPKPPVTEAPIAADSPVASTSPDSVATTSLYGSLKTCKVSEINEEEDWSVSHCEGPGGYGLIVDYGDARDDLRLVRPGSKPIELGLLQLNGGGFNSLGDAVEWRGTGAGPAFTPTALIVRNNAALSPERPEQQIGFLVVIDLAQGCAVAQVRPMAAQNEQARKIADGPKQPCLKGRS